MFIFNSLQSLKNVPNRNTYTQKVIMNLKVYFYLNIYAKTALKKH